MHRRSRGIEWTAASLHRVEQSRSDRRAYYVIDRIGSEADAAFRIWRRTAHTREAELLGEHASLATAKSSVPVTWHDASLPDLEAWGFGESIEWSSEEPGSSDIQDLRAPAEEGDELVDR